MRFRSHRVALTADIEKAFLQLQLAKEDRDFVRSLWPADPTDCDSPIVHCRYTRVVFGVTSSSFLLGAAILNHLDKYESKGAAFAALQSDRFVDDLVTGAVDEQSAIELANAAVIICEEGGFPLRKFASNSAVVRESLRSLSSNITSHGAGAPPSTSLVLPEDAGHSNVLGLDWRWTEDDLAFEVNSIIEFHLATRHIRTKKMVLRTAMKLYDLMGLVTPLFQPSFSKHVG